MTTFTEHTSITFKTESCITCGTRFAMDEIIYTQRRQSKEKFYCPNGHSMVYRESDADRLRAELLAKEVQLRQAKCEALAEHQKRDKIERELKRHKTRTKNGVCPCCNRSFTNLRNHIATQHPDYSSK